MFTEKDSQSGFSLHSTSGQKNFIQSLLAIIIKRQLCKWKIAFVYWNPIFQSLCRWRSKLKYILLCNEDIIKMWSHKRESDYNHCNGCPVYSADWVTSCKVELWHMPLLPTAHNNFAISWEITSSRISYFWTIQHRDCIFTQTHLVQLTSTPYLLQVTGSSAETSSMTSTAKSNERN